MNTHDVAIAGTILTKRFTAWSRGEHRREWVMLRRIHTYEPDLVPRPVAADLDADPPWVTMTVVRGIPLDRDPGAAPIDALAAAIRTLWSVPSAGLETIAPWRSCLPFARRLTDGVRPDGGVEALAFDAAVEWWHGGDPALLDAPPANLVIGHGDANSGTICSTPIGCASSTSRTPGCPIRRPNSRSWSSISPLGYSIRTR